MSELTREEHTDPQLAMSPDLPLFGKYDLWFAQVLLLVITSVVLGYMTFRFFFPNPPLIVVRAPTVPYQYVLDINQADWVQLMLLPEVGEKLAKKIIEYRDAHGPFTTVDDLIQVKGIGKTTLDNLRPHLKCEIPEKNLP